MGHAMRCLALAEELSSRGATPLFFADIGAVPFMEAQLKARQLDYVTPQGDANEQLEFVVQSLKPDAIVVDSYLLPVSIYARLRVEAPLLAIVDGDPAGRPANIYLDQNIGAETQQWPDSDPTALRLAGLDYVLIRDDIRGARPASIASPSERVPDVLAVFGGTDPYGASPVITDALIRSDQPFNLTVVAPRAELVDQIGHLSPGPDQRIEVIAPTDRFASLAAESDLVISAAGSSSWELLCLGSAVAFVCVADNQRDSYARIIESGYGYGLGYLDETREDLTLATDQLARALSSPEERLALREKALSVIDGRGRARVADALLNLVP